MIFLFPRKYVRELQIKPINKLIYIKKARQRRTFIRYSVLIKLELENRQR